MRGWSKTGFKLPNAKKLGTQKLPNKEPKIKVGMAYNITLLPVPKAKIQPEPQALLSCIPIPKRILPKTKDKEIGAFQPVLLHPLINLALLVAVLSCFLWSKKAQVPTKKIFILLFVASVSLGLIFLVALSPWQVTFGFTLWGAKLYSFLGGDLVSSEFWNLEMPKTALQNPLLRDTSTLVNLGVILGALAWVSFSKIQAKKKFLVEKL